MTPEVFFCTCGNLEHQIIILPFDEDDDDDEETLLVCISASLCDNGSLWGRVRRAIKYIFGHRSNYGMFAETLLTKKETIRLIETLERAIKRELPDVPN